METRDAGLFYCDAYSARRHQAMILGMIGCSPSHGETTESRGDPYYALANLLQAVSVLATGTEGLKPRLEQAHLVLATVFEGDLPDELQEDLVWVRHELTKRRTREEEPERYENDPLFEGWVRATLRGMRFNKAQQIAERICYIAFRLDELLGHPYDVVHPSR